MKIPFFTKHPIPKGADTNLVQAFIDMQEYHADNGETQETYPEFIQGQIDNYEQIWRESARSRDRDSCEKYLQILRREFADGALQLQEMQTPRSLRELLYQLNICHDILSDAVIGKHQDLAEAKCEDLGQLVVDLKNLIGDDDDD